MKRLLMTILAALAASVVSAADVRWTGSAGDGLWATKKNWQGNALPTGSDTAVFEFSGRTNVFVGGAHRQIGGFRVDAGELFVDGDFMFNCSQVTTEVSVASGALLVSSNNWYDSATYSKTLLVKGGGDIAFRGIIGYATSAIKQFKSVVLSEGSLEVGTIKANEVVVGKNMCLNISAGSWTGSSTPTIVADGATLRFMTRDAPQTFTWPTDSSSSAWRLKVGESGVRVDGLVEQTYADETYRLLNWYATATSADGADTDGGIEFSWPGVLTFYRPQSVKGPVAIKDGFVSLRSDSFTGVDGAVFGTNDFILGNCWLQVYPTTDKGLKLASGSGAKLRYGRSATICVNRPGSNVPQTITIGSPDAESSPLERTGKGGVLVVATAKSTQPQSIDGQGGKVLVNGGVATHANGLVKDPILAYSKSGSSDSSYFYRFMRYDATLGLVACTNLYTAGLDGGPGSIANLDAEVAEYSIADGEEKSVLAFSANGKDTTSVALTLGAGATLHVGNGVDPACVILNNIAGYGNARIEGASGKINFGASEGVFAVSPATGTGRSSVITSVLAGSGGVTFSGVFGAFATTDYSSCVIPAVTLSGTNTYSGGTWINSVQVLPTKSTAFGSGTVDVGAGMASGGQIRFGTAGLNFANDFVIRGHGVKQHDNSATLTDNGALWFVARTEISGNVEIDRFARISMTNAASGVRATLSGVVSGGRLKLRDFSPDTSLLLSNSNTYTGGTEVVSATLAVAKGDSLGTGEVVLDGGVLRFENAENITFTNKVSGTGTIVLAGKGSVTFTDSCFDALPVNPLYRGSSFPIPNVEDGDFRTRQGLIMMFK
ncbi:MAG: hypothetical protein IJG84_18935 [Kiritimatiellae bacterium]|nr:hypothetical protein [Kiritimatiellia bacterium]